MVLAFGVAQRAEVSVGSPFGLQGGVRFPLVPLLLDGRVYGGVGLEAMGGGVDLLLKLPLTDLYLGLGGFYGTGPVICWLSYRPVALSGFNLVWEGGAD